MKRINRTNPDLLTRVMLELTQASVLEREPIIPKGVEVDWDRLLDMSQEHGLTAWVWDSLTKMSLGQKLSRQQRIDWGLSFQEVIDGYERYKSVFSDLIKLCQENHIRILLLKGFGLSDLYPFPQLRSFGDIDVFPFDDYEKLSSLLGGNDETSDGKHSEFLFEGVEIENHKTIIYTHTRKYQLVSKYLDSTLSYVDYNDGGYYVLSAEANLVFLLVHSLTHLNSIYFLSMRNVLDIAMFLYRNHDKLEPDRCEKLMRQLKLSKSFELFVYLCEWVSGLSFADYHFCHIPQKDIRRAYKMLEYKEILNIPAFELPYFTQLKIRWKDYRKNGWKYKYMLTSKKQRIIKHFRFQSNLFLKMLLNVPMDQSLKIMMKQRLRHDI